MEMGGKNATRSKTRKIPIKYGNTALDRLTTSTSQILETAYKLMPTGGVNNPIIDARIIMTPN